MAYNRFTLTQLEREFGLRITERGRLFAEVAPVGISERLQQQLTEDRELAINSNSEKARSEF